MNTEELPVSDHTDQGIKLMEEERRRIARDLHDGPTQILTNLSMRIDIVRQQLKVNPAMADEELARIGSRLVASINDIRRLIYDLRPIAIDEVGLASAVEELCRRCEKDWALDFRVHLGNELPSLAAAKQVATYRLIQEILNNMKKHANARTIQLSMFVLGTDLIITIRDDGKGFDPTIIPAGHYGLIGMRERAEYLGGQLEIHSEIGKGSEFKITIPVMK